jgi:YesN/AraC family two-component response regulator
MDLQDASILVVDDEAMLLEIFSNWFKTRARKVFSAANGALAMKILEEQDVDLIITDVRMPVMDGVTLLKKIHGTTHQVPSVIFLSGFSDVDARDAYELGAEAFIENPFAVMSCLAPRGDPSRTATHCGAYLRSSRTCRL